MIGRLGLALVLAMTAGCFYDAPINQRPSVSIRDPDTTTVFRTDSVTLVAITTDPENQAVSVQWSVFACTDASDASTDCDALPFDSDTTQDTTFIVPAVRADVPKPVIALRVLLDAKDELGAAARPTQELIIPVDDHPPELTLRQDSSHDFVVGSHITLDVDLSDPDDDPGSDSLAWQVTTPAPGAGFTLSDQVLVGDVMGHITYRRALQADVVGAWTVAVTATDPLGATTEKDFALAVGDDLPPCITAPSPIATPNIALPLIEPTLFEVPIVLDDLDVYPPSQSGDPDVGVATFHWSISPPGDIAFEPVAVTGNSVPLDPANYESGDVLELRVEVHDRIARDFSGCDPDAATCALNAGAPTCFQRTTWTVRIP